MTDQEKAQTQQEDFEVHLDLYEGPLALLLHLIERDNLDIFDIPIAEITHEYLRYLDFMRAIKVDMAGEFLVMAASLMQIKARMLLPRVAPEDSAADPRQELVSRLLVAQRYARAAQALSDRMRSMQDYSFRPAPVFEEEQYSVVQNVFDLFETFRKVLEEFDAAHRGLYAIGADPYPVEAKIAKIMELISRDSTMALKAVWEGEKERGGLIASFLAVLELIKRGAIRAVQKAPYGEIILVKVLK
ncbi:MAG: segregation/condensation protein A [Elusimicrobia bacterium]|nr:segregation/condensation protein A [Elusimicrobiota bacterium]